MPTTRNKSASKVQAKLGFSPVSKESAQAQELSPSVRSRASAVRYYSPSSQPTRNTKSSTGLSSFRGHAKVKSKQQKLQLGPTAPRRTSRLTRSDDFLDDYNGIDFSQRRSSPGPFRSFPLSSGRNRRSSPGFDNDETGTDQPRSRPADASSPLPPLTSSPPASISSDDDDEDDQIVAVIGSRRRPQILDDDDDSESDIETDEVLLPSVGRDNSRSNRAHGVSISGVSTRSSKKLREDARRTNQLTSSEAENSEYDGYNPKKRDSVKKNHRSGAISSEEEDEDAIITSSARVAKRRHVIDEEESGEELGSSSPAKRQRLQHGSKPRRATREEQDEEIFEDAEDLRDNDTYDGGLRSASTLNSKKAARQRELAKLQRRRNKTTLTSSQRESSSPSPEPELPIPYNGGYSDDNSSQADSIINDDVLSDDGNASEDSEIRMSRSIHSVPSALYYVIQSILYDKFIPPSNTTISENTDTTRITAKPVSETYYLAAHGLIDKHMEGYRNQFVSSVWRRPFIAALYARPKLNWPRNVITLWESCEACGRRDRPASYAIRFEGHTYNETTLAEEDSESEPECESESDPNDNDNESESESNNTHHSSTINQPHPDDAPPLTGIWAKYNEKVPQSRIWHVGSDCHDNAWRAHRSAHWKFGLAVQIDKVLAMMGVVIKGDDEEPLLEREDTFHATLLQMEEQGYMRALTDEFLERFEMDADDYDEED